MTQPATTVFKATHDGTCQICGSRQRLPAGVLAKHGYDVRHGYFNGVCHGSEEVAYEASCKLLAGYVQSLASEVRRAEEVAARLQGDAPDCRGHHEIQLPGSRVKLAPQWGLFLNLPDEGNALYFQPDSGTDPVLVYPARADQFMLSPQQQANRVRGIDRAEAESHVRHAKLALKRQQERLDAWLPRPPLPLTNSPEERAERAAARGPRLPTKAEVTAKKFRDGYVAKHGKEPIFTCHQTTSNNPALDAFQRLCLWMCRREDGWIEQMMDERELAKFTREASRVMNLRGQGEFLRWVGAVVGKDVEPLDGSRARDFKLSALGSGAEVKFLCELTGDNASAKALAKRGPLTLEDWLKQDQQQAAV